MSNREGICEHCNMTFDGHFGGMCATPEGKWFKAKVVAGGPAEGIATRPKCLSCGHDAHDGERCRTAMSVLPMRQCQCHNSVSSVEPAAPVVTPAPYVQMKDDGDTGMLRMMLTRKAVEVANAKGRQKPHMNDLYNAALGLLMAYQPAPLPSDQKETFEQWWKSHAGPKSELAKLWADAAWNAAKGGTN